VKEADHRSALEELRQARAKLDPTRDIRAYAELTHGMAIHAVAGGLLRQLGIDLDNHRGMTRQLQQFGHSAVAQAFGTIESIRMGRWYGRQGDGGAAHELDEFLAQIEAWSVA
jgi:hypothetical protein